MSQCKCGTPSEIKAAFQELEAALNAQLAAQAAHPLYVKFLFRLRSSATHRVLSRPAATDSDTPRQASYIRQ